MKFIIPIEEYDRPDPIVLSSPRPDGFGLRSTIRHKKDNKKVGYLVYRLKNYLSTEGYPKVAELHMELLPAYQGKGLFQWIVLAVLRRTRVPVWVARNRAINPNVKRAIDKLDPDLLEVVELEWGWLIRKV